jgi:hypothetical protein
MALFFGQGELVLGLIILFSNQLVGLGFESFDSLFSHFVIIFS